MALVYIVTSGTTLVRYRYCEIEARWEGTSYGKVVQDFRSSELHYQVVLVYKVISSTSLVRYRTKFKPDWGSSETPSMDSSEKSFGNCFLFGNYSSKFYGNLFRDSFKILTRIFSGNSSSDSVRNSLRDFFLL